MDKPGAFAAMYRDQEQPQSGLSWDDVRDAAPGFAYSMLPPVAARDAYNAFRDGDPLGMGLAAAGAFIPAAKLGKKALDAGLDMSQAARMARAKEMGFDTDKVWYHGTDKDIESFNPDAGVGDRSGTGSWFTSSPEFASSYAPYRGPSNVVPAHIKDGNFVDVYADGRNWSRLDPNTDVFIPPYRPKKVTITDADKQLLDELGVSHVPARAPVHSFNNGESTLLSEIFNSLDDASTNDVARWARENNFDGVRFHDIKDRGGYANGGLENATSTNTVVFDPSRIRSVNAAFDPAKKNSANLLDSAVPGAVVGGSAYGAFAPANEEQY